MTVCVVGRVVDVWSVFSDSVWWVFSDCVYCVCSWTRARLR